jgi:hypothetical protein
MSNAPFCSPAKPWGLHPIIVDNLCPRCGWLARPPAEGELQDGNPPAVQAPRA